MGGVKWESNTIPQGLQEFGSKVEAALFMYATTKASTMEAKMKSNRPWTDRTNLAKTMLSAKVYKKPNEIHLVLSHGVDYGIWLELSNNKKYAILKPTVDSEANGYFAGIKSIISKIKVF